MGNSDSKYEETIYDEINSDFDEMEIDDYDKLLQISKPDLEKLSLIHTHILKKWGMLLYKTGAIVLKNPTISSVILGIFFQIARETNEYPPNLLEITTEKPFLFLKANHNPKVAGSISVNECLRYFYDFVTEALDIQKVALNCLRKIEEIIFTLESGLKVWELEYSKYVNKNPYKMKLYQLKSETNQKKLKRALNLNLYIEEIITSILTLIVQSKFIDSKKLKLRSQTIFDNVFTNIFEASKEIKSYNDNCRLYWNFTDETKISEYEEYYIFYKKIEKLYSNPNKIRELIEEASAITVNPEKGLEKDSKSVKTFSKIHKASTFAVKTVKEKMSMNQPITKEKHAENLRNLKSLYEQEKSFDLEQILGVKIKGDSKNNSEVVFDKNILEEFENKIFEEMWESSEEKYKKLEEFVKMVDVEFQPDQEIAEKIQNHIEKEKIQKVKNEEPKGKINQKIELKEKIQTAQEMKEENDFEFDESDIEINIETLDPDSIKKKMNEINLKIEKMSKIKPLHIYLPKNNKPIKSWTFTSETKIKIGINNKSTSVTAFIEQDNFMIIGTQIGKVFIYNIQESEFERPLVAHTAKITAICYLHDSKTLITASKNGEIFKWNYKDQRFVPLKIKLSSKINDIIYLFDGERICFSCENILYFFDIRTKNEIKERRKEFSENISKLIFNFEKKLLILGFDSGKIRFFDIDDNRETMRFEEHKGKILSFAWIYFKNSLCLAVSSQECKMSIISIERARILRDFESPETNKPVKQLVYCWDERSLLMRMEGGHVGFLNYQNKQKSFKIIYKKPIPVKNLLYLGDSTRVVLGYKNVELSLLEIK